MQINIGKLKTNQTETFALNFTLQLMNTQKREQFQ